MCNKNLYKRFCAIIISLGVVLSVGQYAYAHNPKLIEAEYMATQNPTIETLGCLCALYKQDVEYHKANEEYAEAQKSEAGVLWAKSKQLEIIANNDDTPENWENVAQSWADTADLYEAAGNTDDVATARINAIDARNNARQARYVTNNNASENCKNEGSCSGTDAALSRGAGVSEDEAQELWEEATKANDEARKDRTPESWKKAENCWDETAAAKEAVEQTRAAITAEALAA